MYSKQQTAKREKQNGVLGDNSHTRPLSVKVRVYDIIMELHNYYLSQRSQTASLWKRSGKVKGQKSSQKKMTKETHKELSEQEERELERSRWGTMSSVSTIERVAIRWWTTIIILFP